MYSEYIAIVRKGWSSISANEVATLESGNCYCETSTNPTARRVKINLRPCTSMRRRELD